MTSPFKFLDSYTLADRDIFFGREQEITELYRKVFESKILLVYGISGTGKSSLINCGLASRFDDSDWLPVNIRRGNNIIDSLNDAINKQALSPLKTNLTISEKLKSVYLDQFKPIYLIFDQFEELFIFGDKEERKSFIQIVRSLIESEIQCRLIFVMREEYMAGVTEFERYIPTFFANRVRIEKMAQVNALEAINGPCKVAGISLEEGFAESLLEKISPEGADVELTYLQVFLDRILRLATTNSPFEEPVPPKREGQGGCFFTISLLSQTGNVSDLLGSFLDEQISLLSDPDVALAVLKSFVSIKGTKRQMTSEEVKEYTQTLGKQIEDSALIEMLQNFVHLRILRDKDQNERYELRHDALAAKIYEKFSAIEKDIIEVRQFIENAFSVYEKRGKLLTGEDLEYIAPYESKLYLSKALTGLIEISKDALVNVKRRRRNVTVVASIALLLILSGFTIWAIKERNIAQDQRNKAMAEKYNFLARDLTSVDPTKALRLAEYARSIDTTNLNILNNIEKIYYENNIYHVLSRHNYFVSSLIFFHDGLRLLTGSSDKAVRILDMEGNEREILKQESTIESIALSPDEQTLLTGSGDNITRLYNINGNLIQLFKGHTGQINSVAFSHDGKKILTCSDDSTARLWDTKGNVLQIFTGHTEIVKSAVFSPDDQLIATGSFDKTARLWDQSGKLIKILKGPSFAVGILKFSPDGKKILAASEGDAALLWDLNGNLIQQFIGHQCSISTVDFSPDGQKILTASCDHTCRLWDIQGNMLQVFKGHNGWIPVANFSPDGQKIISASADKTVRLWDLRGNSVQAFKGHKDLVLSVSFSPDGQKILTGSFDNTARLWDLSGQLIHVFEGHSGPVFCVAFSPDGTKILTGSDDQTARLWSINEEVVKILKGHSDGVHSCCFSPDGLTVLTGSDDYTLRFWDLDGNEIKVYKLTSTVKSIAFSPDGQNFLTGSGDHVTRLWDLKGNVIRLFRGGTAPVISVAFSPDGKKILSGSYGPVTHLFDINGNILAVLKGHITDISSVAFAPDGQRIVTVSDGDNAARIWNIRGEVVEYLRGHTSGINSVKFSPDGRKILTGSFDFTAKLWSLKMSYQEYRSKNKSDNLEIADRIKYDIIPFSQVIKLENETELSEAADYYFQEFRQSVLTDRFRYLGCANLLYRKLTLKHSDNIEYLLNLLKSYYYINESKPSDKIVNEIKKINEKTHLFSSVDELLLSIEYKTELFRLNADRMMYDDIIETNKKLLSFNTTNDLIRINDFYFNQCRSLDSIGLRLQFPESIIIISEKLINSKSTSISELKSIAGETSDLSFNLLKMKEFKISLDVALLSLRADSSNEYIYSNLPLAYIFNNKYNEAQEIYLKYKDRIFRSENDALYKKIFLQDIGTLENQGIVHSDFKKVKELLKK